MPDLDRAEQLYLGAALPGRLAADQFVVFYNEPGSSETSRVLTVRGPGASLF
jgi:hypothetical protein